VTLPKIDRFHDGIETEGAARWQLKTTIDDLFDHIKHQPDQGLADQLRQRLYALRSLCDLTRAGTVRRPKSDRTPIPSNVHSCSGAGQNHQP
jgi:hypothetical protein